MTTLQPALSHQTLQTPANLTSSQSTGALITTEPALIEESANDATSDDLDNPAALKKAFAERCNWETLAAKLRAILEDLHSAFPPPFPVSSKACLRPNWRQT